jgi:hypothetical protein
MTMWCPEITPRIRQPHLLVKITLAHIYIPFNAH